MTATDKKPQVGLTPEHSGNDAGMTQTLPEFDNTADAQTIVAQVGRMNILAISGGRVVVRDTGVTLPVGHGYSVTIDLAWNDTYTVRRVFKRGNKVWIKGERTNVYFDDLGECAYVASCYVNREFGE